MRLNFKTYPIWKEIEEGKIRNIDSELLRIISSVKPNEDSLMAWFSVLSIAALKSNGGIGYLTEPFRDAIRSSAKKITSTNRDYMATPPTSHILMQRNGGTMVFAERGIDELKLMLIGFDRESIVSYAIMNSKDFGVGGWGKSDWLKSYSLCEHFDLHQQLCDWFTYILLANFFIKNCEIETKELSKNQKHKSNGYKYLNELKTPVQIYDCTWFTKLVSTIPYHVKGFFRWQPHGERWSKRKLIWVNEFERIGFTRKAKKETANIKL